MIPTAVLGDLGAGMEADLRRVWVFSVVRRKFDDASRLEEWSRVYEHAAL